MLRTLNAGALMLAATMHNCFIILIVLLQSTVTWYYACLVQIKECHEFARLSAECFGYAIFIPVGGKVCPPPLPLGWDFDAHAFNPLPDPPGKAMEPSLKPCRTAVVQLLQAAQVRQLAITLPDEQKRTMSASAQRAIYPILDDRCEPP
jgi:hypothetical protein